MAGSPARRQPDGQAVLGCQHDPALDPDSTYLMPSPTPASAHVAPTFAHSAQRWLGRLRPEPRNGELPGHDEPLRAELYSADQMAQHAKRLAATDRVTDRPLPDRLLARLTDNERVLAGVYRQLAGTAAAERRMTPAAEWLLDNFYLIEEEVGTARRYLPRGYSRELPRLVGDALPAAAIDDAAATTAGHWRGAISGAATHAAQAGQPRVYALALQMVAHSDARLSRGTLARFIAAYQTVQPLLLGELWAVPIMLRLALIENLRRVGALVAASRIDRDLAASWAARMLQAAEKTPSQLILLIADMARTEPPLSSAFVAEFARRLQGQGAALALPLTWLEQRLGESGSTIEQRVHAESQQQAADQVSVANSIGSLRLLGAMDWRDFVETLSGVEQTLRGDPAGIHAQMDFATRDRYRHAVERMARLSRSSEVEVARQAVALATAAGAAAGGDERLGHVGYYLVGPGCERLESAVGVRLPRRDALQRRLGRNPLAAYGGTVLLLTLALTAGPLYAAAEPLGLRWWQALPLALLLLLATSQLAMALVNWVVTLVVVPRVLPRMDYSFGIASQSRTLVVVPTLLNSPQGIDDLAEALEVRFLANRDAHLHFGLLTDFRDAPSEHMPGDDELVAHAAARIEALNAKYAVLPLDGNDGPGALFYLFHRPRRWNLNDRLWMGRERKRGKLGDLNALLRGKAGVGPGERFSCVVGDPRALGNVRYVITLDTDTQLPRDAAAAFVATMAHPLNRPRFSTDPRRPDVVVEGYGILQPRVGVSLSASLRSGYARLHGGDAGIDPYTRAVSDVYQDLFGEGSFIGKGIYDVDAFERALADRLPANRVLSHDLIEGCYARAGLLSDALLVEEPPVRHAVDAARRHRWIRGDWQLVGWLAAAPSDLGAWRAWKIADNLRRSLVPAALVALLLVGWALLPEPALWTLRVVAILALVPLAAFALDLVRRPLDGLLTQKPRRPSTRRRMPRCRPPTRWRRCRMKPPTAWTPCCARCGGSSSPAAGCSNGAPRPTCRRATSRAARPTSPMPHGACGSRRRSVRRSSSAWRSGARRRCLAPAGAAAVARRAAAGVVGRPAAGQPGRRAGRGAAALPAPHRAPHLGLLRHLAGRRRQPPAARQRAGVAGRPRRPSHLADEHRLRAARRADGARFRLAQPRPGGNAHRGHAGHAGTAGTPSGPFPQLVRHETLQPLRPRYVSAVDSGNLAGYLLVLASGLRRAADEPAVVAGWADAVHDTLDLLREALGESARTLLALERLESALPPRGERLPATQQRLDALAAAAAELLGEVGARPPEDRVDDLPAAAEGADATMRSDAAAALPQPTPTPTPTPIVVAPEAEALHWAVALEAQCREAADGLRALAPSTALAGSGDAGLPTLSQLAAVSPAAQLLLDRLQQLAGRAAALAAMEYGFLYDASRHLMHDRLQRRRAAPRQRLLRPARLRARLASFVAIAQGQAPQDSWFALGRLLASVDGDPVLLSWSGSMFEYLMPLLVMPSYAQHAARPDLHAAVRAADRLRPPARRAVGHLGVGLQRRRHRTQLPVPRLRRARPGPEARPRRRPRHRAVRLGDGADGRAGRRLRQPAAPRRHGRARRVRLLRGDRLHADAAAARAVERAGHVVHGASPGHERCWRCRTCCSTSRCSAASRPIRSCRPPCCCCRSGFRRSPAYHPQTAERTDARVSADERRGADPRHRHARHADARGAAAVERPLPRHGHQAGGGYSRWQRPGRHPLARGRHPRRLGQLRLPARHRQRRVLVDRAPADAAPQRPLRGDLLRGPRRVPAPRPRHRRAYRDRRLAGGRHRAAARAHHQLEPRAAQHRDHQLRRGGARAGGGRRAASGVQQAVRADRDPRRAAGDAVHAAPALARRGGAVDVPADGDARRARHSGRRRAEEQRRWSSARDRPRALHRPRQHAGRAAGAAPAGRAAVEQRRLGARPGGGEPPASSAGARRDGDDRHRRRHGRAAATPASRWPTSTATGASPTASSSWPGRTARWCCASSTPARPMPSSTASSPAR